nr:hypothetical protein [Tanacetum cinerariifolium]
MRILILLTLLRLPLLLCVCSLRLNLWPLAWLIRSEVIDSAIAHEIYASLRNYNEVEFLDCVNVNSAQHACIVSELCLWLEKAKCEAAEVGTFRDQVSRLEVAEKVAQLESEYECLRGKVKGEAKLKEQFIAMQDVEILRLAECGSDLDARLSQLSYHVDSKLYPHMLTAVAGRRWVIGHGLRLAFMKCCQSSDYQTTFAKVISLAINQGIQEGLKVGIKHGKARRELGVVAAYDPEVMAKYEEVVGGVREYFTSIS